MKRPVRKSATRVAASASRRAFSSAKSARARFRSASMPSVRATDGLRRSASTNSTLLPGPAAMRARFQATVVFPSPSELEVTSTDRGLPWEVA